MQNCVVLNLRGDDVVAFFAIRLRYAAQNHVVALAAAAGKIDFRRICRVQAFCNGAPRFVKPLVRVTREAVEARRIAVKLRIVRDHRFDDLGQNLGGCCIVKINVHVRSSFSVRYDLRSVLRRWFPAERR